jgi:hypothetical protein
MKRIITIPLGLLCLASLVSVGGCGKSDPPPVKMAKPEFAFVANYYSNEVSSFTVDAKTGCAHGGWLGLR